MQVAGKLPDLRRAKLSGKRVLVRLGVNVPFSHGKITDDFRIRACLPTLEYILRSGGTPVLMAHLEPIRSIKLVQQKFEKLLKCKLEFLPNLRTFPGEKKNNKTFAKFLAGHGNLYINEAFSVSHRNHASIVGVTHYLRSFAGLQFMKEVSTLEETLQPPHPFLFIMGGVKFDTKVSVLNKFLKKADYIFLGGALANTFLGAFGMEIGKSVIEKSAYLRIRKDYARERKLILPLDVYTGKKRVKDVTMVTKRDKIYDIGPMTLHMLQDQIRKARMVLWNGPLGYLEYGHDKGTREVIRLLRLAKGKVIIGGGDTHTVIRDMRAHNDFYHLSTGGGAMLEFLEDGEMPGITALRKNTI